MAEPGQLLIDLVRAETRLYNVVEARLRAEHDLTLGTFQFLQIMHRRGTCRVYDIAHEVDITVGATSKGVDRIEARGWCRRLPNPDDRRSSLLTLTPAGRRALTTATPTFQTAMAEILSDLPPRTMAQLAEGLSALRRLLEAPAGSSGHPKDTGSARAGSHSATPATTNMIRDSARHGPRKPAPQSAGVRYIESAPSRFWQLSSSEDPAEGVELAQSLTKVLDQLTPATTALWDLMQAGYEADWFCYLGSFAVEHAARLDRGTLSRLLALPDDLLLDVSIMNEPTTFDGTFALSLAAMRQVVQEFAHGSIPTPPGGIASEPTPGRPEPDGNEHVQSAARQRVAGQVVAGSASARRCPVNVASFCRPARALVVSGAEPSR